MNPTRRITMKLSGSLSIALSVFLFSALAPLSGGIRPAAAQEARVPSFFSTKINVSNLEKSLDFYTRIMGLKVTGRVDNARITEVVLTRSGEGAGASEQALILYYAKDRKEPLVHGNTFNNLLFVFPDLKECLKLLDAEGYKVTGSREPRPVPVPFAKAVIVLFTKDPDGFTVELVQYFN